MKKYRFILFSHLFLLCAFTLSAKTYLINYTDANKINKIAYLDSKLGVISKQAIVGKVANGEKTLVNTHKNSQYIAVLAKIGENSKYDEVVIFHKQTLQEYNRIKLPKVRWDVISGLKISPIFISNDDSKLVVISKTKSNLAVKIYAIDGKEPIYSRNLGKNTYQIFRSDDDNYLLFESLSAHNRLFVAIDIQQIKTSSILNLGKSQVRTYIFKNTLFISRERSPRRGKYYTLSKVDISQNKKILFKETSKSHFVFATDKTKDNLFIAGQNKSKKLFVLHFTDAKNYQKTTFKKKIKPLSIILQNWQKLQKILILGHKKLATISFAGNKIKQIQNTIKIPFDPLDGILNKTGTLAYVQENLGSEVAVFDLLKGKLIKSVNAGRVFNHVLLGARKIMIGGSLIELIMMTLKSTKNMLLSNKQDKLFVINATTNDVTIFRANNLEKISALATGFKTYFIHQGENPKSPILVVGENRISLIDNDSDNIFLTLKNAELVGLDKDDDILFYVLDKKVFMYDMRQKKIIKQLKLPTNLTVLTS